MAPSNCFCLKKYNLNIQLLFALFFPLAGETAAINNRMNNDKDEQAKKEEKETNIEHHGLSPVEIVGSASHGRVARVPEEVIQ